MCTITGDAVTENTLSIEFSGSQFDGTRNILDSVEVTLTSANSAERSFMLTPAAPVVGATATFTFADSLVGLANPKGLVTVYMREDGKQQMSSATITDAVKPKLVSVSILENENHENENLTVFLVTFLLRMGGAF